MSRVAIVRCRDYERERVFEAVKRAVDLVGGIEAFVKPGMKVLLKPNLLSARRPEEGVDTHPEVVRAAVRLVKAAGGDPSIGDSPGGFGKNIEDVFEASGIKAVANEEGARLVKFTGSKFADGFPISRYVFDSDLFISIPKFKTHGITVLTGAVKNIFGTVVGPYKAGCHARAPRPDDFAKLIARIYAAARPHLTILDGIIAMEGDGPSGGDLRPMEVVMASRDAVAVDSCLARIMAVSPGDILTTREAHALGLGEMDPSRIEAVGDSIDGFVKEDFKLPQTTPLKFLPRPIADKVAAFIRFRPLIDPKACRRCNLCKISCPVDCIRIEKDYCGIDYKRCVRCLCCHEVCPYNAVHIKRNIVTKAIWG